MKNLNYLFVAIALVGILLSCSSDEKLDQRFNYLENLKLGMDMESTEALFSSRSLFFSGNAKEMKYDLDENELHQKIIVKYDEDGKSNNIEVIIDFSNHKDKLENSYDGIKTLFSEEKVEIEKNTENIVIKY